jgi:hypothetical protein
MIQEVGQNRPVVRNSNRSSSRTEARLRGTLQTLKRAAAQYRRLNGKPLGVTDEVAHYVAAETLGLTLVPDPYAGYDALRGRERIQIAARAYPNGSLIACPRLDAQFEIVMLVVLDPNTLDAREIWEVTCRRLNRLDPRRRIQGLPIHQFKKIAKRVWKSLEPSHAKTSAPTGKISTAGRS